MALAVDAAGKVKANPKTGKTTTTSKKGGASALWEDLGGNELIPSVKPVTPGTSSLSDVLKRASSAAKSMSSKSSSSSKKSVATPRSSALPQVTTASSQSKMTPSFGSSSKSNKQQAISSDPYQGTSGSTGSMSQTKPISAKDVATKLFPSIEEHDAGLDAWERMAANRQGREVRTANVFGDDYDMDGSKFGWIDNQLDLVGNTPMNDAYLRDAIDNGGLSMDDAWAIMNRPQSISDDEKMRSSRNVSDDLYANVGKVLDDGTKYDYAHMTSDTMTGTQYLHYVEMGMGGRPIEQIDPTKTYSKRRESINYGFVPFTPDISTYANDMVGNALDVPSRAGMWVANMREHLTPDYMIEYGDGNTVSGRDYDRLSEPYMHQFQYYEQFDPERYLSENDNSTPLVREYEMPSVDGGMTYHYGGIATDEGGTRIFRNDDGTYDIEFTDGSVATVPQTYMDSVMADGGVIRDSGRIPVSEARGEVPNDLSSLNDMDKIRAMTEEYGGSPLDYADVLYLPDLVLSDGKRMTYSDVDRLYHDQTPENDADDPYDDDITYKFSGSILPGANNKPKRLMKQEMFEDGRFDPTDLGNNAWDWTFGSLPISIGAMLPWIYSTSGARSSLMGADPGTYDVGSDSHSLVAGGYDENGNLRYGVTDANGNVDPDLTESTRWWNAAGNAAVPLTEMMVGPVGEQIVPLERIFGELPANPTVAQVIKNTLIGAAGEGVEEDLGNIFDEITQYGPVGMFSNQAVDENGNPIYDTSGHEIRDYGTRLGDRFANAINADDLANSFAGGVTVDLLMDALLSPLNGKSFTRQIGPAVRRDMARRKTGVNQYVETERERAIREALENGEEPPEFEWQQVPDSYLAGFSGIDREVR